jgi:hypothetical protein
VFCKLIFSNKFGFILETVFSYIINIIGTYLFTFKSKSKFDYIILGISIIKLKRPSWEENLQSGDNIIKLVLSVIY